VEPIAERTAIERTYGIPSRSWKCTAVEVIASA
jgi:hypothetical protein